ncbi:MAG: YraN family protein [Dehalococcoidia bacterium]|nr:YraN family protein [Dehalococcoidia bacterium]
MKGFRGSVGAFGERLAAAHLEAAGMTVLARNVRTPGGEIDIVAHDGTDLVFVEVRTRRAPPGVAAESLHPPKLRRMWQCAMDYCETHGENPERVRIDLVALDLDRGGRLAAVEHFRGLEIPD